MHHCNPHCPKFHTASEEIVRTPEPRGLSIRSLRACEKTAGMKAKGKGTELTTQSSDPLAAGHRLKVSQALWPGSRGAAPMAAKHPLARPGASAGDRKLHSVLPVEPGSPRLVGASEARTGSLARPAAVHVKTGEGECFERSCQQDVVTKMLKDFFSSLTQGSFCVGSA